MKGYSLIIAFLLLLPCINAQYWFQSGARGGQSTQFNSGAQSSIQTVTTQIPQSGSIAYWIGEDLQNGAFLQTGYVIENQSGRYPSRCDTSGCYAYEYISAGAPEWFYEYFPPGNNNNFYGAIGPNDSAGQNNSINTYGFYANGTQWKFIFNGNVVGQANLGSNTSGYNDVVAFGELANTSNTDTYLVPVKFYNVSIYRFGRFILAPTGYSYIGYGVGSLSNIPNIYGVQELGARADAFEMGSNLALPRNNFPLWQNSYNLAVVSPYGNINSTGLYIESKTINLQAPALAYLNASSRVMFTGWIGSGPGSYTGSSNNTEVLMYGNITETATWQLQYLVNVTSQYGAPHGSGWYPANSIAYYSISANAVYQNSSSRAVFQGWSNGTSSLSGNQLVNHPLSLVASWQRQYLISAISQYGNTTGSGWYPANSTAHLSVLSPYLNETPAQRLAFYSWSDGNRSSMHSILVNKPHTLYASYKNQYLVRLSGIDEYGSKVGAQEFYLTNSSPGKQFYLYGGQKYLVKSAIYRGNNVTINQLILTNSSQNISVQLPLYDIQISATDVFGRPLQVPVSVTLANGTVQTVSTNANGTSTVTVIEDVPYGKALASTQYLGLQLSSSVQYGENIKFTVLSLGDMEIFAAILALAVVIYYFSVKRVLRHEVKTYHQ